MKKLIAVAVALTLVVSGAFAVEFTGQIHSGVTLIQGDHVDDDYDLTAGGHVGRLRLQATGQNEDGTFGAWIRSNVPAAGGGWTVTGHAWWRPMEMFWMAIGTNPDGFFNAEGRTGWQFYRGAGDARVANPGNFTGIGAYASLGTSRPDDWDDDDDDGDWNDILRLLSFTNMKTRNAFFSGFGCATAGDNLWGLAFTIRPIEMISFNFGIPFITMSGDPVEDIYRALTAQVNVNLDFGRIAITYAGNRADNGAIFAYFGMGGAEDALRLDVGFSVHLYEEIEILDVTIGGPLMFAGLGVEVDINDQIGLRSRLVAGFGGGDSAPFSMFLDLLPFFRLDDNMTAFVSLGMALHSYSDDSPFYAFMGGDTTVFDFHVNPYIEISAGPASFFAGVRLWSEWGGTDNSSFHWAVPIGITINF